jgi:hypothetical protein
MSIIPRAIVLLAPCIPHLPARSEHALLDQVGRASGRQMQLCPLSGNGHVPQS